MLGSSIISLEAVRKDTSFFADDPPQDVIVALNESMHIGHVGYVKLRHSVNQPLDGPALQLSGLSVIPDWQGQGIGYRLVTAAMHVARGRGSNQLLAQLDSGNSAAQQLLQICGFSVEEAWLEESRSGSRSTDGVLMGVPLTDRWFKRKLTHHEQAALL